jgi:membrane protease YdiL (CAAX protease family)
MIGVIVQLAISWLLVWLIEKKNLSVLGFWPTKQRLFDFALFFMVTAMFSASGFLLRMYFAQQRWQLNTNPSINLIAEGIWWNIKSVLFEELIFRGVLFYILIKRIGAVKAIVISAIAFGIYHWFSHEVIGSPVQMIVTFLTTGSMGLIYAYGYAKTYSLYLPIAIHLGWNLVQSVVFSETVIGNQLLVIIKPIPVVTVSYFQYFAIVFFPFIGALLSNYLLIRKHKQVADR